MKLISSILFSVMVLAVSCVYGQDTKPDKAKTTFSAKLYAVSTFQNVFGNFPNNNSIEIPKSFSPTISWGREYGNYNEVELTDFNFSNKNDNKQFQIGSRYSYNWRLFSKSETSRFSYFIGAGVSANYSYHEEDYKGNYRFGFVYTDYSNYNTHNNRNFNVGAVIIPRMNVKIGERIYLDVNLPYNIYNYQFNRYELNYKDNRESYVSNGNQGLALPNKFTVNVGVAIKF